MKSLVHVALVLALAFGATPALAQKKLSLADRVAALEEQSAAQGNSAGQQNVDLVNRLAQLQTEVQALRNQVETLQNDNEQLKQRSKDQYVDLDTRLQRMESAPAAAPPASAPPPARPAGARAAPAAAAAAATAGGAPRAGADGEQAYKSAFDAIKRDDFVASARGFQDYLRDYPDGSLAPNAWYWLGESYYATQNYPLALQAFTVVPSKFPDSPKAPDALLKKGFCQIEMGQVGDGAASLDAVIRGYPDSDAARRADLRLRELGSRPR